MFSFFTCSASIMIKAFIKAVPSMFTIAAQIVLHSVVKAMDWRNNVYVPVRKLLAIFFAIAIVTNSDSGKHWKHIFHGQVILNIGWQKMKLAVDLSVWTIYCMKHIFVLKLTFFCQTWIFFLDLRTFLSNFVPTDVNALLLKSYPEDFRPILSWASSNPILGRNLSSTPVLNETRNYHDIYIQYPYNSCLCLFWQGRIKLDNRLRQCKKVVTWTHFVNFNWSSLCDDLLQHQQ